MSLFTTKHKRFSSTTLQQLFFRKLSIYFIRVKCGWQVFAIRMFIDEIKKADFTRAMQCAKFIIAND